MARTNDYSPAGAAKVQSGRIIWHCHTGSVSCETEFSFHVDPPIHGDNNRVDPLFHEDQQLEDAMFENEHDSVDAELERIRTACVEENNCGDFEFLSESHLNCMAEQITTCVDQIQSATQAASLLSRAQDVAATTLHRGCEQSELDEFAQLGADAAVSDAFDNRSCSLTCVLTQLRLYLFTACHSSMGGIACGGRYKADSYCAHSSGSRLSHRCSGPHRRDDKLGYRLLHHQEIML